MIPLSIHIQVLIAGTIGGIAILMAAVFWLMPRLTRPDLYFAVTVPVGFRDLPEGKSILKRYRAELIVLSVVSLIGFAAVIVWLGIRFVSVGVMTQVISGFIAFYLARRRTLPYAVSPSTIREAELHEDDRVISFGWIAASGPFLLLGGIAVFLWIHGIETSTRLINGQTGEFRGGLAVYLLTIAGVLTSLTLVRYGIARWVRPLYAAGAEHARELRFRRTVSAIVLAAEYYVILQASWVLLVDRHSGLILVVTFPLAFVFVLVVLVMLSRLGQGGSRALAKEQKLSSASVAPVGDRTPDRYWKLGVFYFNRDDAAIFIEKRFGLGYSLNFARPIAWFIIGLILMAPLIPLVAHLTHFLAKRGI
jgi:uncharacterized membrane protein